VLANHSTQSFPKNIHKTLTTWRNKQTGMNKLNLTSIFVIWERFGDNGGVNETILNGRIGFQMDFDFERKNWISNGFRFCDEELKILNGFRFWIGFGMIFVSDDDHVFIFGMKMEKYAGRTKWKDGEKKRFYFK